MGRDLQKRKNRSSRSTVKQSQKYKKPLNPMGNSLIARNWNKKETLSQNYRRLGLVSKLGKATGGVEARPHDLKPAQIQDPLAVSSKIGNAQPAFGRVKVQRDEDGKIVRVLRRDNPLNDPLNAFDSDADDDAGTQGGGDEWGGIDEEEQDGGGEEKVVHMLEREAAMPEIKHVRHQSQREREWLQSLIAKHGNNTMAMARDLKLNPMQQTAAAITKKLKIFRKEA